LTVPEIFPLDFIMIFMKHNLNLLVQILQLLCRVWPRSAVESRV
jgi:hypothetical protein